jgi:outer membrane receptor protein involved in Fe transport
MGFDGGTVTTFGNYTLQDVTSRSGDNAGKRLKAVPRHTLTGGITLGPWRTLETSLLITRVGDVYIDDANTIELPDFTRVDARAGLSVRGVTFFVDARNLFDRRYSSSGFVDPGGTGEIYFYPAAGRALDIGVRGGW